jgi:hypothetical protein
MTDAASTLLAQAQQLKEDGCSAFVRGSVIDHPVLYRLPDQLDDSVVCATGDHNEALSLFSDAITHLAQHTSCPPDLRLLLSQLCSNRSATLTALGHHQAALKDAHRAARLAPTWPKARLRHGLALVNLGRLAEALLVAQLGLQLQHSTPDLQELLDTVKVSCPCPSHQAALGWACSSRLPPGSCPACVAPCAQHCCRAAPVTESAQHRSTTGAVLSGTVVRSLQWV